MLAELSRRVVQTGAEYRKLLIEYRRSQLTLTTENVKRLETVFDRAVQSLTAAVANATEGTLSAAYYGKMLANMESTLQALRDDFAQLLTGGMATLAQNAADREAATAALVGAKQDTALLADISQTLILSNDVRVTVTFGRLALSAVERVVHRVYSDGWQLSDRLYNLDSKIRTTIQDTIVQGVAEQISARKLAGRLRESLAADGSANPRYDAMRIARTEIVSAHREAHIQSTIDQNTGKLKEFILGVGYRLSASHGKFDICDVFADDDGDGLGPGNYLPDNFPGNAHPNCMCYSTTVLVEYPDVSAHTKEAQADDVPESQVQYYATKYADPAAIRWLEKHSDQD